nr:uncharacterized protein LOC123763927 isoform X1 [Procambarus clarkii]
MGQSCCDKISRGRETFTAVGYLPALRHRAVTHANLFLLQLVFHKLGLTAGTITMEQKPPAYHPNNPAAGRDPQERLHLLWHLDSRPVLPAGHLVLLPHDGETLHPLRPHLCVDPRPDSDLRVDPRPDSDLRVDPRPDSDLRVDPRPDSDIRVDPGLGLETEREGGGKSHYMCHCWRHYVCASLC